LAKQESPSGPRSLKRQVTKPVDVPQDQPARIERFARADDHPPRAGIEMHHIERIAGGHADAAALADGEMDDAGMLAEHPAVNMHDLAGQRRIRA
jgi:hypothetical protein